MTIEPTEMLVPEKPQQGIQSFKLQTIEEMYRQPEEAVGFFVDGLLPSGGLSVLAGKPKAGKTTLARQLVAAVALGEEFLGRDTVQGSVLYFALEEKAAEVKAHLRDLGVPASAPVHVWCNPVDKRVAVAMLDETLAQNPEVKLVVIDPLFRFGVVKDIGDYIQTYDLLESLLVIARKRRVHIMAVHHMKKRPTDDDIDGALGSTAITGGVDTFMALKVTKVQRTISTRQRYGKDMPETQLAWDELNRKMELTITMDEAERIGRDATKNRVLRDMVVLVTNSPGCTQDYLLRMVVGNGALKKRVLKELIGSAVLLEEGAGTKGNPYTYRCVAVPSEA